MERTARDLRSHVRLESDLLGGQVKARGAIHAVSIKQRHTGHAKMGADSGEFLGQGSAFEKAECRTGVKLYKQVLSTRYSVLS